MAKPGIYRVFMVLFCALFAACHQAELPFECTDIITPLSENVDSDRH